MSSVSETLTHKLGPLPTWAWVAIGAAAGYLLIVKKKGTQASASQVAADYLGTGGAGGPAVSPSGVSNGGVITPVVNPIVPIVTPTPTPLKTFAIQMPDGSIQQITIEMLQQFQAAGYDFVAQAAGQPVRLYWRGLVPPFKPPPHTPTDPLPLQSVANSLSSGSSGAQPMPGDYGTPNRAVNGVVFR